MKSIKATLIKIIDKASAIALVESSWKHPLYKKTVKRSRKYLVQNDKNAPLGAKVIITETRPLSARKRFTITGIITK